MSRPGEDDESRRVELASATSTWTTRLPGVQISLADSVDLAAVAAAFGVLITSPWCDDAWDVVRMEFLAVFGAVDSIVDHWGRVQHGRTWRGW